MSSDLQIHRGTANRFDEDGLELAPVPAVQNNLGIHKIDVMDQIYTYKGLIGQVVGWILYHFGYAVRVWDEDAEKNSYMSLRSIVACLCNTPNKNIDTEELANSRELNIITLKFFNTLENFMRRQLGEKAITRESFEACIRNFRSQEFTANLQLAGNRAQAEQLIANRFQPFFNEITKWSAEIAKLSAH